MRNLTGWNPNYFATVLLLVLLAALSSCGGGSTALTGMGDHTNGWDIPGLPTTDAPGNIARSTSAYTFGEADIYGVPQGATMSGSTLTLQQSGLSYAILGVNTGGQHPASITITGTMSGLYAGVSNYAKGVWKWIGNQSYSLSGNPGGNSVTLNLPASGTLSPGGSIYIALVCPDSASGTVTVSIDLDQGGTTWNLLVWIAGDNNLAPDAAINLNQMESVGSTDSVRILAGYDIDGSQAPGVTGLDKVRFIKVVHDTNANAINTTGDAANVSFSRTGYNSADPARLAAFLDWAETNFPADHTALVLWDHGDGWLPGWKGGSAAGRNWRNTRTASGILGDDQDGNFLLTDNTAVAAVLAGRGLDLLAFDACNMAHLEALYDYRSIAPYICASQALFPGTGLPYDSILNAWNSAVPVSAAQLSHIFVDQVYSSYSSQGSDYVSLTAVNTAGIDALAAAMKKLAADIVLNVATEKDNVQQAIDTAVEPESSDGERDLQGFLTALQSLSANATIDSDCSDVLAKLGTCNAYFKQYLLAGTNGISAFLPTTQYFTQDYQDQYATLTFDATTDWLAMLQAVGVPGGGGTTVDWTLGDKLVISWGDTDIDMDVTFTSPDGLFGAPYDPTQLMGYMNFSADRYGGNGTTEWGQLKAGAIAGDYTVGIGYNTGPTGVPCAVSVKLYNSSDVLKQDLGICTVDWWGYVDFVNLRYTP